MAKKEIVKTPPVTHPDQPFIITDELVTKKIREIPPLDKKRRKTLLEFGNIEQPLRTIAYLYDNMSSVRDNPIIRNIELDQQAQLVGWFKIPEQERLSAIRHLQEELVCLIPEIAKPEDKQKIEEKKNYSSKQIEIDVKGKTISGVVDNETRTITIENGFIIEMLRYFSGNTNKVISRKELHIFVTPDVQAKYRRARTPDTLILDALRNLQHRLNQVFGMNLYERVGANYDRIKILDNAITIIEPPKEEL